MIKTARLIKSYISMVLCIAMVLCAVITTPPVRTEAAVKKMTLALARELAIKNSDAYESAEMAVDSKTSARESALKSMNAKLKNKKTFRWSPLLSFKFPQKFNFTDESDMQLKPITLAGEINVAQHKLQDVKLKVSEDVCNLYVEIVTLQNTIEFEESSYEKLIKNIDHDKARLKMGDVTQADIDRKQKKADTKESTIAANKRQLEADLKKFSGIVGLDVSTGYVFENPYVEKNIDRTVLDDLITYTEDRDQGYYEACVALTTAKLALNTNYDLMKNHYGNDINIISKYVKSALNGTKISNKAFKNDYKKFLDKIDSYWKGKKRIMLFVKIPREWMKGDVDGIRYIEDDPYVLYQNTLDYISARKDEESAKKELDKSVEAEFNNYINTRNSYQQALKDMDNQENLVKEYGVKNRMGLISAEEYEDAVNEYEELRVSMLDSMKAYTQTLFSFDRLTCGGVSALVFGTGADMKTPLDAKAAADAKMSVDSKTDDGSGAGDESGEQGEGSGTGSYDTGDGDDGSDSTVSTSKDEAMYYLTPIIQRELFELSVYIPKGFPIKITHFELWCDKVQIGERTPIDKTIRHLTLAKNEIEEVKIRFYKDNEFVDDCVIDPSAESGVLNIVTDINVSKEDSKIVGSYVSSVDSSTGMMTIKMSPKESEGIASFTLKIDGQVLGDKEKISVDTEFKHLGLVSSDLSRITIEFYNKAGSLMYTGYMDTKNGKLVKND